MQRLFFGFIKIVKRVVGVSQYLITGNRRCLLVHVSPEAVSKEDVRLDHIAGIQRRHKPLLVR